MFSRTARVCRALAPRRFQRSAAYPGAPLFSRPLSSDVRSAPREAMEFDVVIVGAGPAGLSAAIRLKQKAAAANKEISVCIVEKGAEVGRHILSGNVFNPISLNELIPDWQEKEAPVSQPVTEDRFFFLTEKYSAPVYIPPALHNEGNYIISLGNLCKWMASHAEGLGVEIFPGFAASEALIEDGKVVGVATGDMGIGKDGQPKDNFTRGMELRAKQTLFAEGVRGSLSEGIMKTFNLRKNCDPQSYGIGLKEVWEVDPSKLKPGYVQHTVGWPLSPSTYGGSFMYHMAPNKILLGFVVALNYRNPYINPYEEFQRFKHHHKVKPFLEGGTCISYGARAINEGGYQSIPKLTFPGGALIGCSAGFLNVPKIKGAHYAMKSGMIAADEIYNLFASGQALAGAEISSYEDEIRDSWVVQELKQVRNIHHAFGMGLYAGMIYSGLDLLFMKGRVPWTFHHKTSDADVTDDKSKHKPIEYPKPDGVLTFDLLTNLQRSGTYHEDDQPAHLKIKKELAYVPKEVSMQTFAAPETRFCPAKVYEYVNDEQGQPKLVINAANCLHCKTCSIKMPKEYIDWTVPEGGGGPNYEGM